jgi:hypothetical protein
MMPLRRWEVLDSVGWVGCLAVYCFVLDGL